MAHRYPEGEQAKRNELERRVLQADVDIKRLWKALPDAGVIFPIFDGNIPEPPDISPHPVLVFVTGVNDSTASSSYGQVAAIHDAEFAGAYTCLVHGDSSATPAGADDLDQYKLIYLFHDRLGSFPSWIGPTAMAAWLSGAKQRRLVILTELFFSLPGSYGAEVNTYLSSLGSAMATAPAASGTPGSLADSSGYYLNSGSLTFAGTSFVSGGTLMYRWNGTTPGDMMRTETFGSGAEVIVTGDTTWSRAHSAANATFIKRLFPYNGFGGIEIP